MMANECGRTHHRILRRQVIGEDPHIGWPEVKAPANTAINNHPEIPSLARHELGNLQNRPIALVLFVFTKKFRAGTISFSAAGSDLLINNNLNIRLIDPGNRFKWLSLIPVIE